MMSRSTSTRPKICGGSGRCKPRHRQTRLPGEQVLAELASRRGNSRDFIRPQRQHADIVVQFYPPDGVAPEEAGAPERAAALAANDLAPRPELPDHGAPGPDWRAVRLGRDGGHPVDFLEIDGHVTPEHAAELEEAIWEHLPDLHPLGAEEFGDYQDRAEVRHSDPLAIAQLLLTYHLLRQHSHQPPPFAPPVAAISRMHSAPVTALAESGTERAGS